LRAAEEQTRRREFRNQFKPAYDEFRALDLGNARHSSEHRVGYPPYEFKIKGRFGAVYEGSAIKNVPSSETREIDDARYAFLIKPVAIHPHWQDFTIDGKPLFDECRDYLQRAETLIGQARAGPQYTKQTPWTGNASDLLRAGADAFRDDRSGRSAGWPKSPRALAGRLRRAQTSLRGLGIEIAFRPRRTSGSADYSDVRVS
jgi:hypothetical protein